MPVEEGIEPILALLDDPPAEPISAWMRNQPTPLTRRRSTSPPWPYSYAAIRGTAEFEPALTERLRDDLSIKYVGRTYAEHVERTPEAKAGLGEVVAVRVRPERIAGRL